MPRTKFAPPVGAVLAVNASALADEYADPFRVSLPFETSGAAAIVDVRGPLAAKPNLFFDSYEELRARVAAALASPAAVLVLRIDSPGGEAAGMAETARDIRARAAAAGKRVLAFVEGQACSAAYALACSAEAVYATPSSLVGSVGCIKLMVDGTGADRAQGLRVEAVTSGARKADGNPHVAISEGALAAAQLEVDAMAAIFFGLVGDARRMSPAAVKALEAQVYVGADATAPGLIDGVASLEDVLALASGAGGARAGAVEASMTKAEAIAALKALAEEGDEQAKKALAAMTEEPDGDEKKPEEKAEHEEPDGDEAPPKKEEPKAAAPAPAATASAADPAVMAIAQELQAMKAERAAEREATERRALLASRPDLAPAIVTYLSKQPIAAVREAVKSFPKAAPASPVEAARAALHASTPTRGEGTSDAVEAIGRTNLSGHGDLLDSAMGQKPVTDPVIADRTTLRVQAMTRSEARAFLAAQAKKGAVR